MAHNNTFQNWRELITPADIETIIDHLAKKINAKISGNLVVACILKGAVYFTVDLTRKLQMPHSLYFIEASSYKDSQKQDSSQVEILSNLNSKKFVGKNVLLLDELWDNGKTLANVKSKIMELGVLETNITTCTLLLKPKNKTEYPLPDIWGLEVPNVWLVGYGLDDQQEKRQWTSVFAKPKIEGIPKHEDDKMFENDGYYINVREKLMLTIQSLKTLSLE